MAAKKKTSKQAKRAAPSRTLEAAPFRERLEPWLWRTRGIFRNASNETVEEIASTAWARWLMHDDGAERVLQIVVRRRIVDAARTIYTRRFARMRVRDAELKREPVASTSSAEEMRIQREMIDAMKLPMRLHALALALMRGERQNEVARTLKISRARVHQLTERLREHVRAFVAAEAKRSG